MPLQETAVLRVAQYPFKQMLMPFVATLWIIMLWHKQITFIDTTLWERTGIPMSLLTSLIFFVDQPDISATRLLLLFFSLPETLKEYIIFS